MKAHLLGETGDILVTGTQDIERARPAALACLVEEGHTDDEAAGVLEARTPRVTAGATVPTSPADRDFFGYTWWWRDGHGRGRVKAVIWE